MTMTGLEFLIQNRLLLAELNGKGSVMIPKPGGQNAITAPSSCKTLALNGIFCYGSTVAHNHPGSKETPKQGYLVVGWNDSVNLMEYATHALQVVFRWHKGHAQRHIMEIHNEGKSVLACESTFESAEYYVHQLQSYGMHATMEKEE